ncbi:SRPBCC domain-containing protein [Azospirillum formosense]|uniref:SRPBCC family protein n=1 Tax=Azospirillum formosense TaxID=861533 RepID=UPI00338D464B
MDMSGSQRITAPRDKVWAALNDPEILRQCIPGCEEVQKTSDTEFTAKVVAKVGPVSAKFSGKVTLSDLDPPNGYTITGEGSGGAAGFGKGGAKVSLQPDGEAATVLSYTANATVGGKLAQIGSRLVDATARKMADDFFNRFTALVGGPPPEPVAEPITDKVAAPVPGTVAPPTARSAAAPQPVTPAVAAPAPEIPIPLPAARGRGGFYVPWAALGVVAVLVLLLAWMK